VSYKEAVIAYLASVAKKGIDMVGVNKGESFLVIGMGVIGLSAVQLLKIYGAGRIIAGDMNDTRLKIAKKYTEYIIDLKKPDPIKTIIDMNDGKKVDVVIEASGNPKVVDDVFDYVRPGGRIHLQGQYREPVIITRYSRWNCSDLRVSASIALNPGDKEEILKLISEGKFDANLWTEEYYVDDAQKAYEKVNKNKYDILKVLFKWED
jgi:2-desacetyl-2-hydroxyethyl bacteriochlorophyllide A dehydrogenase